jgi:hypothetical protein
MPGGPAYLDNCKAHEAVFTEHENLDETCEAGRAVGGLHSGRGHPGSALYNAG